MAEEHRSVETQAEEPGFEEDAELYSMVTPTRRASPAAGDAPLSHDADDLPFHRIEFVHDVPLRLSVEIGQNSMTVRDILALNVGSVVEFTKVVGEPMDITVSGRLMARGEIVVVNERYGVRISEVTRPDEAGTIVSGDS